MTKNIPELVHTHGGRWYLEFNGIKSEQVEYRERLITTLGRSMFAAQTEYWGKEAVWNIQGACYFTQKDES